MIKNLFDLVIVRIYLTAQIITRLGMVIYALLEKQITPKEIIEIFARGLVNDLISLCYFLPVISLFSLLLHKVFHKHKLIYLVLSLSGCFLTIFILIFIGIAEIVFWDEFGTKFNFIAVDYLIYTHEIIGTLKESLPLREIIVAFIITGILITYILRKYIVTQIENFSNKAHLTYALGLFILGMLAFNFYEPRKIYFGNNKFAEELSKNGSYELFSAYYNNSLDYNKFYPVIDSKKALQIVRSQILQDNQKFLQEDNIDRVTLSPGEQRKYNVILITVESLSAEFLKIFGNSNNITPHLDKIADEGILFTNIYATGTRTVRGLEAITLSLPPTPGSSIVRRPNNHNLFNIGSVFKDNSYEVNFFYGGYSYFDNLENYFGGNGYRVIDRSNLSNSEISTANIWGVADEDILFKSLEIADQNHKNGKLFFSLIMTTSNHRPYTFPENRIDLPSGGGRNAAVKYTDYAIGKFIEKAKTRLWFDNTIFVITADHCASSAGKGALPIPKYHIPLIIYAPGIIQPQKIDSLASQIDIAPTIFGLINLEYKSKFFGQDIINFPPRRAFISTYQLLGYMKDERLVILSPNSKPKTYRIENNMQQETEELLPLTEEAVSFYKTAYDFYMENKQLNF